IRLLALRQPGAGVRRSLGVERRGRLARHGGDPHSQERQGRMAAGQAGRRRSARQAGQAQVELRVAAPRAAHAARVLREAARSWARRGEAFSVSLVTDREMRRLNREWRGKDQTTDVLSWEPGEIVISLDTARRQASAWSLAKEL